MTDEKESGKNPEEKNPKNPREQTTGIWTWFRKHELAPGHEDVEAELKEFYEGAIALYCPDGNLNSHQKELLQRATHKLGFCKLCEKAAWKKGPIYDDDNGKPQMLPSLSQQYIAFTNGFRLDMREFREISVGKGKKDDLKDYLERAYGDKASKVRDGLA